jgi:hypothetical protein
MHFAPSALSYGDSATSYKLPLASGGNPSTPNGQKVVLGSTAYRAIAAQIDAIYGPFPRPSGQIVNYRDVKGYDDKGQEDGYIYRQMKDGTIYIQVSGYKPSVGGSKNLPAAPVPAPTVGSGAPINEAEEGWDWKTIAMYGIPSVIVLGVTGYFAWDWYKSR